MNAHKPTIAGVVALVIAGLLVPPAQAHQKRRSNPAGPLRWVSVRHSHSESEPAKPVVKTQAKAKGFDPLKGAAGIVAGTLRTLGKTVGAIFGDKAKAVSQTQKDVQHKSSPQRHKYRLVHKHPSGIPWRVRTRAK